jgi:ankyrin
MRTPLSVAAEHGHEDMVRFLLDRGAWINLGDRSPPGRPPLHHAVAGNHVQIAKLLLEHGADPNSHWATYDICPLDCAKSDRMKALLRQYGAKTRVELYEETHPLFAAVFAGDAAKVQGLVRAGADVRATFEEYRDATPLHFAAWNGHLEIAKILLASGADVNAQLSSGDHWTPLDKAKPDAMKSLLVKHGGKTYGQLFAEAFPLHEAVEAGDLGRTRALMDAGSDLRSRAGFYGNTPLHVAAESGRTDIIRLLMDGGAGVDARNKHGRTPFHLAVSAGHKEAVDLLLKRGADPTTVGKGKFTALHLAAGSEGSIAIAELLVGLGADVNAPNYHGHRPLGYAKSEAMKKLLRLHGAKTREELYPEEFPLHAAAEAGDVPAVKKLLDAGEDVEKRNWFYGYTPLHLAAGAGHLKIAKMLVAHGAEIDAASSANDTPLHRAAVMGREAVVQYLLDRGADPRASKRNGYSILHDVAGTKHVKVAALLIRAGADVNATAREDCRPLDLVRYSRMSSLLKRHGAKSSIAERFRARPPE